MGLKIKSWNDVLAIMLSIFILFGIIGIVTDFWNWKQAIDIIKKEMPTEYQAQPYTFIKGFGYIPFVWRGNFKRISVTAKGTPNNIGDLTYVVLQIGSHEPFFVNLKNGYGDFHSKELTEDDLKSGNTWYEQEFKDAVVYVKLTPISYDDGAKVKVLVFMETEENHWLREVTFKMTYHSCGGGYWQGGWVKG